MFIDDMKKSILQKAIQWKLVEQNPNDDPASELLKRIREEKEKLIKDGKIKKEKGLLPITDEEKPFDIPSNWWWTKIEEISYPVWNKFNQIQSKEVLKEWKFPAVSQWQALIDWYSNEEDKVINDLPLIMFGDHTRNVKYIDFPFVISADWTKFFKPVLCDYRFVFYLINYSASNLRNRWYARHYSLLKETWLPIPPLEEQERIVAKLDELMLLLDEARPLEEQITKLEKDFPSKLRQSILQYAIQWKLVEQNSADEPASELLKKIKEEKERLIKEWKIKKEKTLEPITDEEKFLDLWWDCVWVRLWEIAMIDKWNTWIMKAIPWEYPMYTTAEQPITHNEYQIDWKAVMIPLVSSTGHWHASMKRLHYWEWKFAVGSILSTVQPYWDIISAKYLYCYLSTFKERLLVSQMKWIANVTLSIDAIKNVVVPIPSTKNQEKLEELVKLCDELEEQIG